MLLSKSVVKRKTFEVVISTLAEGVQINGSAKSPSTLISEKVYMTMLNFFGPTLSHERLPENIRHSFNEKIAHVYCFKKNNYYLDADQQNVDKDDLSAVITIHHHHGGNNNSTAISQNRRRNIENHNESKCCEPHLWVQHVMLEIYDINFILSWLNHIHGLQPSLMQIISQYIGTIDSLQFWLDPHESDFQPECNDEYNEWASVDFAFGTLKQKIVKSCCFCMPYTSHGGNIVFDRPRKRCRFFS